MSGWSPPSLKLSIPTMIIVFSGFMVLAFYTYNLPRTLGVIETEGKDHLFQRLSHLQGTLEYMMRHDDIAGSQREIAALASQEEFRTVVLADDAGQVIAATRRAWLSKPIDEVVPGYDADEAVRALRQRSAHAVVTDDGEALAGFAGIALAPSPTALRPDRFGQLFIQYDLSKAKHAANRQLQQQSLFWSLIIGVLAVLLWFAFHVVITRRAERLIGVAERLAQGDLSARSNLSGRDELARLSEALDTMAGRIDVAQQDLAQDIDKRKQAELAVRESEERLQQILNGTTAIIYVRDKKQRFLLINHEFERALGIAKEQVVGKTLEEVFPPDTAAEFRANDQQVWADDHASEFEEHVTFEDGVRTYLSIKFPLYDTAGQSYAICGFSTDITRRKKSETALRQAAVGISQARGDDVLHALVTHLAGALNTDYALIGTLKGNDSIQTRSLCVRGAVEKNIIYPLKGSPCENVIGQRYRFYPERIQQQFPDDNLLREIEMESYAAVPLFASDGQVLGLIAVLDGNPLNDRELTESILKIFAGRAASELERERTDAELRQSELSYRGLFNALEDSIFIHDIDTGAIVDVNPKASETYGYSRDEFSDINVGDLSSGEGEFNLAGAAQRIERAVAGESLRFEWHRKNKDGSLHWDEVFLKRVQLAGIDRILAMTREITARKKAEQNLRESERQYREANERLHESEALKSAIIENALLAVISMDDSGCIVEFNPAAEKMFGYERDAILGKELAAQIIPERLRESHRVGLQRYLERPSSAILGKRLELTGLRSDGNEFPVELSISATRVSGTNYFTAFIADLTEVKRSEAALRASEEQYRAIFRASTDGLALWRNDGTIVDLNPTFCEMHGYTHEEFLKLSPPDFIAADSLPAFEAFRAALREGKDFRIEARGRRKNGTEMDLDVRATPIMYQGTQHQLTILRDITERKAAEAALRASEQQYRGIFNAATDGLGVWRPDGNIVDFNPALCGIFGYTYEELTHISPYKLIHPSSVQSFEDYMQAVANGTPFHAEATCIRKDGEYVEVEVRGVPMHYRGAPHHLSLIRDITQNKRAERNRRELESQLRQSQKMEAIGHLTGGIAHDFNNLLTSMMGYCTLGSERLEQTPDEKLSKYLQQIQSSGEKARDLIQQMLTFSRGQRGEPRPLSLAPLINESCKLMRSTIPSSVEFSTNLENDLPPVMLDPVHVEQVMMNLCINARDAMESRGLLDVSLQLVDIQDSLCTACRQRIDGRYVQLSVRDTGSGIQPENLDRIFEPFFTTKEVGKGTGMGLSTVHGIVHEHGGHIRVESRIGRGSEFQILFPALSVSASVSSVDGEAAQNRQPSQLNADVMIVDDEASVVEFMGDLLESRGLTVTLKSDSVDALREIRQNPTAFDLIITDQTMPKLAGTELASAIREINPELPVILYSGRSEQVSDETIRENEIKAFLKKPIDIEGLFSTIQDVLSGK